MTFNFEKLEKMAKPRSDEEIMQDNYRKENSGWLLMSQQIALFLHHYLRTSGTTQKDLAEKMGVSPVYVGRLLKGGENLTLETICKIEKATGREIVSVAKPYISVMVLNMPSPTRISPDAVTSDKFSDRQSSNDAYIPAFAVVA